MKQQTITIGNRTILVIDLPKGINAVKYSESEIIGSSLRPPTIEFLNGFNCVEGMATRDGKYMVTAVNNQSDMFDLMNQWLIDWRDLIGKGLAVSID